MEAPVLSRFSAILFFFYSLLCMASCQAQVPTKSSPEGDPPQESIQEDFDPYFNGNHLVSTLEGPTTITRNILQDKSGDIWFATWEGIVRYDGRSFTNLTNKYGLRRYRAFCLLEDQNKVIWIGTIGAGLYRYDPANLKQGKSGFVNLTTADGLVNNSIHSLYEDAKGNLWIGTGNGLSRFDGEKFQNFTQKEGMPDADVNDVLEDELGRLWIAVRGEACVYDGKKFERIERGDKQPFTNVRTMLLDEQGGIWLGGNDGLWKYEQGEFRQMGTNFTGYLFQDKEGNMWQARSAPEDIYKMVLVKGAATSLESSAFQGTEIASPSGQVFGIAEDSQGNIWFGTEYGAVRYNGMSFEDFRN